MGSGGLDESKVSLFIAPASSFLDSKIRIIYLPPTAVVKIA